MRGRERKGGEIRGREWKVKGEGEGIKMEGGVEKGEGGKVGGQRRRSSKKV